MADAPGQPPPHEASPASSPKIEEVREAKPTPAPSSNAPIPYTTFTRNEKRILTLLLGLATTTCPLTATIYFPLLPLLRHHFHTSAQSINITLTIYVIFQALSPAIFGPLSDSLSHRPVYLLTLSLYVIGNLGLAVNKYSYSVLIALRALQSLGASAAFALSHGVVADVCVPSERGRILGPVSMALNLGACVGPIIGGWVAYTSGSYEWVFWVLVIVGAILLLGVGALLPETACPPCGAGTLVGIEKCMDHNYKATAKKIGWIVNEVSGDDLSDFPIERARSRGSLWLLMISTATLVGYGWAVSKHVQVSVILILQFIQGFWGTCFYTTYNTLLVDVFPESPSTAAAAAAAASITRCAMAAAGLAVLQPLLDAAGRGWYFTLLGLWSGGFGAVAIWLIRWKRMQWRTGRRKK